MTVRVIASLAAGLAAIGWCISGAVAAVGVTVLAATFASTSSAPAPASFACRGLSLLILRVCIGTLRCGLVLPFVFLFLRRRALGTIGLGWWCTIVFRVTSIAARGAPCLIDSLLLLPLGLLAQFLLLLARQHLDVFDRVSLSLGQFVQLHQDQLRQNL